MQTLKDAMLLLGLLLVIGSVRVSRLEPVSLDLVPAAHAATAEPTTQAPELGLAALLPADSALGTLAVEPRVLRSCETQVFRFRTASDPREAFAISVETAPKPKSAPRACKIG